MKGDVRDKKYAFQSSKNIWFISDMHFGHANIMRYEGRPFKNVDEMNEFMLNRWNALVKPNDIVFILGDILFGGSELFENIFSKLNGKKYLIKGNHDYKNYREKYTQYFEEVHSKMFISIDGQAIILNHEPLLCFGGQLTNRVWQFFGHVHTNHTGHDGLDTALVRKVCTPNMYDVGADWNNFAPIKWQQVQDLIQKQIQMDMNFIEYYEYINSSKILQKFIVFKKKIGKLCKKIHIFIKQKLKKV